MEKLKTQFGISATADFEDKTWTFEMPPNYEISAGEFAIITKDVYNKVTNRLHNIMNYSKDSIVLRSINECLKDLE